MSDVGARDFLNKLKWHQDFELEKAKVVIIHRGAPRDRLTISGSDIEDLGSGFMQVLRNEETVRIPYHRIVKIEVPEKDTVWRKNG